MMRLGQNQPIRMNTVQSQRIFAGTAGSRPRSPHPNEAVNSGPRPTRYGIVGILIGFASLLVPNQSVAEEHFPVRRHFNFTQSTRSVGGTSTLIYEMRFDVESGTLYQDGRFVSNNTPFTGGTSVVSTDAKYEAIKQLGQVYQSLEGAFYVEDSYSRPVPSGWDTEAEFFDLHEVWKNNVTYPGTIWRITPKGGMSLIDEVWLIYETGKALYELDWTNVQSWTDSVLRTFFQKMAAHSRQTLQDPEAGDMLDSLAESMSIAREFTLPENKVTRPKPNWYDDAKRIYQLSALLEELRAFEEGVFAPEVLAALTKLVEDAIFDLKVRVASQYLTWAESYFGIGNGLKPNAAPDLDADGDGSPNLIEMANGTNPVDPSSRPSSSSPPTGTLLSPSTGTTLSTDGQGDLLIWQPNQGDYEFWPTIGPSPGSSEWFDPGPTGGAPSVFLPPGTISTGTFTIYIRIWFRLKGTTSWSYRDTTRQSSNPALLSLNPPSKSIPWAGGTYSFSASSNASWTWTKNAGWVTSSESANQSGNQTFTYTVSPNNGTASRIGTITLSVGGQTSTHTITQDHNPNGTSLPLPNVTTQALSNLNSASVTANGSVSLGGGTSILERGFIYATSQNPTHGTNGYSLLVSGSGTGSFSTLVDFGWLTPGTTYYLRAYARNAEGTSYGTQVSFATTSNGLPVVTTLAASNVTQTSATVNGLVTNDGGSFVSERGFVYSKSTQNPVIGIGTQVPAGNNSGSFSATLTGLTPGTTYFVRTYATNSTGTVYSPGTLQGGIVRSFTTLSTSVPDIEVRFIDTPIPNGATTVSPAHGTDFGTRNTGSLSQTAFRVHNTGTGTLQASVSENSSHFSINTGGFDGTIAAGTYQEFFVNYSPTAAGEHFATITLASDDPDENPYTFRVRGFAQATAGILPAVGTFDVTNISATSATAGGNVSGSGSAPVTERGVIIATQAQLDQGGGTIVPAGSGTGSFTVPLSGLTPSTVYYVTAYATSSVGTKHGAQVTFATTTTLSLANGWADYEGSITANANRVISFNLNRSTVLRTEFYASAAISGRILDVSGNVVIGPSRSGNFFSYELLKAGTYHFEVHRGSGGNSGAEGFEFYLAVNEAVSQPDLAVRSANAPWIGKSQFGSSRGQTSRLISRRASRVSGETSLTSRSNFETRFRMSATRGNSFFNVAHFRGDGRNVTATMTTGRFLTGEFHWSGDSTEYFKSVITPDRKKLSVTRGKRRITLRKNLEVRILAASTEAPGIDAGAFLIQTR